MLKSIFKFIEQARYNGKLLNALAENRKLMAVWNCFKYHLYTKPNFNFEKPIKFFAENAARIQAITNMLTDEKSKKIYNSMIKYRQTWNKKDFPTQYYDKIQYFIDEIKLDKNEVFVNCGAFDGDTIDLFLQRCPNYKQIVAFEPDIKNFKKLQLKHSETPNTTLVNAGAWDNDGTMTFSLLNGSGVFFSPDSGTVFAGGGEGKPTVSIQVKSIDSMELSDVTFINMDIEGSELNALKGAEKTILRDKPKLAISIYHSDGDMISIAEYIHNLVPEYKLYVRQHDARRAFAICDTVLYAIM